MTSGKIEIDSVFVARVQQLIKACGTGVKAAKYCGVTPEFLSMVKNGRITKLSQSAYKNISFLFGKSLSEIEAKEEEILKRIQSEKKLSGVEKRERKEKELQEMMKTEERHQEMLAMDKRVRDITIGKRYRVEFSQTQKEAKFKVSKVIYGEVIEIYKRFFLLQTKNFKTAILKKEVRSGIVTMEELGN